MKQVAGLHESSNTSPTPPSLIIVDRLEAYICGPGDRQAWFHLEHLSCAAHLSALLCDTVAFLTQSSCSSTPCQLIASYLSKEDGKQAGGHRRADSVLDVLDRFFQARCTLTQDNSYKAEAAGLHEIWHIYISETSDCNTKCFEDRKGEDQEWQLLISSSGFMEFRTV